MHIHHLCLHLLRLFVWALREYEEADPLILSVDEADEVSIEAVSRMVLKAFDFKGEVRMFCFQKVVYCMVVFFS